MDLADSGDLCLVRTRAAAVISSRNADLDHPSAAATDRIIGSERISLSVSSCWIGTFASSALRLLKILDCGTQGSYRSVTNAKLLTGHTHVKLESLGNETQCSLRSGPGSATGAYRVVGG